jgi:uncharacterized phage-associated protein
MTLSFRERPATQAAARLLHKSGGALPYMKLLKLLYLADRKALLELGRPITFDRYVSMKHGPVLSQTYDLMVAEEAPDEHSYWREHISEPRGYSVRLRGEPPRDALSPAQEKLLDEVFAEFGGMDRWALVDFTHSLPEWQDPHGSSLPIALRDVLRAGGVDDDQAEAIERDLLGEDSLSRLLW